MRVIVAAAVFSLLASAAYAGDQGDTERLCNSGNTFDMVECLKAKTAQWDKRLNVAYQQALKDATSDKQRGQLRDAQRLWIQYRDANCLYFGLGEGTIARLEAGECMRRTTEARARELEDTSKQ
ncbi:lysozyme inhibitor LprI family protein [Tardiphaga sp. P9-11]|jgi:uncharacterized protein YecT (DUF1311 family)|uniref:lysozyme inhibitor LprI family protein n=1 Tax=Tardiphaga sp. P9-11 TaxID=2024614 RepID=UPI001FED43FD|nr:lysozyme inhibitor LprI family protein [Tardiphaga sp. P9-11]